MRAVKTRTLESTKTAPELFHAVLGTVQNGKFTLLLLNNELHRLGFVSGKTAISWGQEYLAEVVPSAGGSTLTLACGSHDKAPKALMDGWKGGKAADKFIAALQSVLDGTTSAPVSPTESFIVGDDGTRQSLTD